MPEIDEIKFVSIHDFKMIDYEDYDIIISTEDRKEKDKRIVVIPNILNETGISTLRTYLDSMNSMMIENATPFSPECFLLFSPEFIFTDLEVKTKEECLKIMSQALEEKHVVTEEFYDSVMDRESKTTTTIGNGVSLPHGSPTAVNESKVGIAILKNPIMWDNEQVQVVFLLAFRLSTRDEISRIQMFYKEYVTLIDSEEKLQKIQSTPHYLQSTDERLDLRHGLGLLLVKEIISIHNGTVSISSALNNGIFHDYFLTHKKTIIKPWLVT